MRHVWTNVRNDVAKPNKRQRVDFKSFPNAMDFHAAVEKFVRQRFGICGFAGAGFQFDLVKQRNVDVVSAARQPQRQVDALPFRSPASHVGNNLKNLHRLRFRRSRLIGDYANSSSLDVTLFLDCIPAKRSLTSPPLKNRMAGTLEMPYLAAIAWASSTLSLQTLTPGRCSSAICSTSGVSMRHGPHQVAQKSTMTRSCDSKTSDAKFCSFSSVMFSDMRIIPFLGDKLWGEPLPAQRR